MTRNSVVTNDMEGRRKIDWLREREKRRAIEKEKERGRKRERRRERRGAKIQTFHYTFKPSLMMDRLQNFQ